MSIPHKAAGLAKFKGITADLDRLLHQLWGSTSAARGNHVAIPKAAGVYLFSENGVAIYVGQTRDLRARLANHCRPSSSQESASFAFLLAREEAAAKGILPIGSRKKVAVHGAFAPLFRAAKERVSKMEVRFLEMPDPETRTVFEVYAALVLGTGRYNSFETH